jgi:hypothetical protein
LCEDVTLSTCLLPKRLQGDGHIIRVDDSFIPKNIIGGCLGGRRHVGKPRGRWENALRRDAVDLFQIRE